MKIYFKKMFLQFKKSEEVIEFSDHITYFHGQISSGKSSIAGLIDFCMGGKLVKTPALTKEFISARLITEIEGKKVIFVRGIQDQSYINVTWENEFKEIFSIIAPKDAGDKPIWNENIYNLSDLIFFLANKKPIKVRRSKTSEESPVIRLSFRDLMWYCYLKQDLLDSSFYNLKNGFKKHKSIDVMKFIIGFYSEKLNDFEIELDENNKNRAELTGSINQIHDFLNDFGFGSVTEVLGAEQEIDLELEIAIINKDEFRNDFSNKTHFTDKLRTDLRNISKSIEVNNQNLDDLKIRIIEQESLKAELLSTKYKSLRMESAKSILSGAKFEICPVCGKETKNGAHFEEICYLCKKGKNSKIDLDNLPKGDVLRKDLDSRIMDLTESINQHSKAKADQELTNKNIVEEKKLLDNQLNSELKNYDSSFLSNTRELDRKIATLVEKKKNLKDIAKLPKAVEKMEKQRNTLKNNQKELKKKIEDEKNKLAKSKNRIRDIESEYMEALVKVGVPGVTVQDKIVISEVNWIPKISSPGGEEYDFFNAGSGGKKTLLNVCYGLSIHKVARANDSPLPTFLIIDTPMKNIGEDVNEDIFKAFYKYLYFLAEGPLKDTQLIIIDKELFLPDANQGLKIISKYMTPDSPLISYYKGP